MKVVDIGAYFVVYNIVIGVLLMLASEKIGRYSGGLFGSRGIGAARLVKVSAFTLGTTVAVLSASIYLFFWVLRIEF